jgi:hypothetical protein
MTRKPQTRRRRRQVGGVPVYCRGCGRRGAANQALLPGRSRVIDECAECRADRKGIRR